MAVTVTDRRILLTLETNWVPIDTVTGLLLLAVGTVGDIAEPLDCAITWLEIVLAKADNVLVDDAI